MRLIALNTTLAAIAELPTFGIVETSTSSTMEPAAFSAMVADSRIGCFPRESAAEITSATRCSTKYGASARPWGPSIDYFTSTSYAYRTKTELLTPKPSITSLSATSTYTEFETAPNNLTKTVYTDTYTWTNYLTTTETVSSIVTVTTSVLQNFTIPTPAGFTAVGAAYPEATQHVDDWVDQNDWSVEDAYWQDQNDYQYGPPPEPELPETSRAGEPTKVDCLVTLVSIYDAGTTTSRSYVPPPTYTRTTYVATETITTTVRTKISPTETPWTYSAASAKEEKSWYTETRTNVDTTTTTEFPSSTVSVYAACATDNIVDTYNGFPLNSLADDWYNKNYTVIRTDWSEATNATACCATAAAIPSAIFFKYDGICEVFVDDKGHGYNASKIDVEVLYEPRERGWWGPTFGNGPRGSIRFSSLWL